MPRHELPGPIEKGPKGPHLALLTEQGFIGIPEGATLWLVEDGSNPSKIAPLVLNTVRMNRLVFQMVDGQGDLTLYEYRLLKGRPATKAALERLIRHRREGQGEQTAPPAPSPKTDSQDT